MRPPALYVMAIYDRSTKKLLRYIIPDYQDEVDNAHVWSYYAPERGELMMIIPLQEYHAFDKSQGMHVAVQAYVNARA